MKWSHFGCFPPSCARFYLKIKPWGWGLFSFQVYCRLKNSFDCCILLLRLISTKTTNMFWRHNGHKMVELAPADSSTSQLSFWSLWSLQASYSGNQLENLVVFAKVVSTIAQNRFSTRESWQLLACTAVDKVLWGFSSSTHSRTHLTGEETVLASLLQPLNFRLSLSYSKCQLHFIRLFQPHRIQEQY